MAQQAKSIDIAEFPDLLSLAEEVRATNEPRVLCRGTDEIATIVPIRSSRGGQRQRKKTDADYEAFLASAGSWADVDVDAFLRTIYERRDLVNTARNEPA